MFVATLFKGAVNEVEGFEPDMHLSFFNSAPEFTFNMLPK